MLYDAQRGISYVNINNLLVFDTQDHTANTNQLNLAGLQAEYGSNIAGTNTYWGLQGPNILLPPGTGLQPSALQFLTDFIGAVPAGGTGTVDLGLEPNSQLVGTAAFADVNSRLDKIGDLATNLATLQSAAAAQGKTLRIIVRFASEMNQGSGNNWQGVPDDFIQAWQNVRTTLQAANPSLLMNFAPFVYSGAVIGGGGNRDITTYWPGDGQVDMIGCTWYAGSGADIQAAKNNLDAYFNAYAGKNLLYAVSELGASCNRDTGYKNTQAVQTMFWHLDHLASTQPLDHVTFFLEQPWFGAGVDLSIVQAEPGPGDPCS